MGKRFSFGLDTSKLTSWLFRSILPPLLRAFNNLPPTTSSPIAPPLTHVIHSLISIPVNSSLKQIWLGSSPSARNSSQNSPKVKTPHDSVPGSRCDSPTNMSPTSPKPSTLDRALSVLAAGRRSLSRTPSPNSSVSFDVPQRAYDLLDQSLAHYFPGDSDVDDPELRQRSRQESQDAIEDILSPLVVLVTRLCIADEGTRIRVRQWIVPEDLDRSTALEQRSDILGRCLRLLSSVFHARLKDAVGEMLYAMADSNGMYQNIHALSFIFLTCFLFRPASTLSALLGYGNVAGFLFHKGILNAPSPTASTSSVPQTTPSGEAINPITGTTFQPKSNIPEMSDEEKEREMEKLFVLFDRLEKTGSLPPDQNPIRKAIREGKMG